MLVIVCVLFFFLFSRSGSAESFPFRSVKIGSRVENLSFTPLDPGAPTVTLDKLAGHKLALVFIGADLAAKKKRSIKVLRALAEMQPTLNKDALTFLIVDVQNDPESLLEELLGQAGLDATIYRDQGRRAYAALGLYVLPSVLLVNENGVITGGLGYSRDFVQRLAGEVDILMKRRSREQVMADLNREMKSVPREQKLAARHLRMGMTMRSKGMYESALREVEKALELESTLTEALAEKGCLLVEMDRVEAAVQALEAALDKDPSLVGAEICLARADARQGHVDDALADLQELLFRHSRNAELHFTIATLQEQKGDLKGAVTSYRKAYELLHEKVMLSGTE